ncbi:hypothetical protein J4E93_004096 [Alternaria ventricosa]|uniref:uncharacterized protein n=1 Tax=Alternaria ventricosa TaxID=1187951 RepID=UPI0020C2CE32|nr:uncharacterized protein J4E93_004096 [Alternaria ventricosa]KAI4647686.1 hypothetical protein J4E93_004096 [Alternaria ventricosa]
MPSRKRSAKPPAEVPSSNKQRDDRARQRAALRDQAYKQQGLRDDARRDQALVDKTRRKKSAAPKVTHQKGLHRTMQVPRFTMHVRKLIPRFGSKLNATNSPLLRLPAELRNIVYGYVFEGNRYALGGYLFTGKRPEEGNTLIWRTSRSNDIGLLLACRQLHAETALLPYKLGVFHFEFEEPDFDEDEWYEEVLQDFFRARSRKQIAAIATMQVSTEQMYGTMWEKTQTGVEWAQEFRGCLRGDSEEY